jgi:serine/threonine-protein kinase
VFLQERMAFFGKLTFFISLSFFMVGNGIATVIGTRSLERWVGDSVNLAHLGATFILGAVWLICSHGKRTTSVLGFIDVGAVLATAGGFALMGVFMDGPWGPNPYPMVLALTHTLIIRAIVVPSAAPRTLWTSSIASLPVMIVTYSMSRGLPVEQQEGSNPAFFTIGILMWCLAAVVVATMTSRVIYGLEKQVREAKQLGQYTLEEKIGEGGMGVVYKASHAMLRRPTAIKLLPPDKAGEESLARFEREVQLTSRLTHPNTIAIYDYGRTPDGIFYYAMEYLQGITLEALVSDHGPQRPGRVIHILRQTCGALAEAHRIGLIHRDIKPANVILCERGGAADVVKVVDFGLVKELDRHEAISLTSETTITGTPLYMSPEAITSPDKVDARSDLYAVGALGYYLVTGQHVFEGGSVVEVCSHHLQSSPVPPSARLGSPVPRDLEEVILECLEKDPARRPKDASALATALAICMDATDWTDERAVAWWAERDGTASRPRRARAAYATTMAIDLRGRA